MGIVDRHQNVLGETRIMGAGQGDQFLERRAIAAHGEDPVGDDDGAPAIGAGRRQLRLYIIEIEMLIDVLFLGPGEAHGVDDAAVVEFVADDRRLGRNQRH